MGADKTIIAPNTSDMRTDGSPSESLCHSKDSMRCTSSDAKCGTVSGASVTGNKPKSGMRSTLQHKYVTVQQAAKLMNLKKSEVLSLCEAGRIPGAFSVTRDGRDVWRIPTEAKVTQPKPAHEPLDIRAKIVALR